jgi:PAS domain S-box-containing protein
MDGITDEGRKKALKEILRQLHAGIPPERVKERFRQFLQGVSPLEIAKIEQELISEGISREEIQRLCDVHLAIFKEQLEKQKVGVGIAVEIAPSSPIHILLEEHKMLQRITQKLGSLADKVQIAESLSTVKEELAHLRHVADELLEAEKHYLREENVLFPVLEKHGITEPPAIMWMEHNKIREKKKQLKRLVENAANMSFPEFRMQLSELANSIINALNNHILKENNILFPTAQRIVSEQEWTAIREDFDKIGYCCFTPESLIAKPAKDLEKLEAEGKTVAEGTFQFETGTLTKEEVEAILDTLPVDITFVDKDDAVKFFNKAEKRIFVRTKAVLGRKVQLCHPQKSIHMVNRILEAFKKGEKDVAEFWIQKGGRLIHIRYFAVRGKDGRYLGTMEVTQDITDLKKIEGEKRLLDWEG